jgi:hypothetical protein
MKQVPLLAVVKRFVQVLAVVKRFVQVFTHSDHQVRSCVPSTMLHYRYCYLTSYCQSLMMCEPILSMLYLDTNAIPLSKPIVCQYPSCAIHYSVYDSCIVLQLLDVQQFVGACDVWCA